MTEDQKTYLLSIINKDHIKNELNSLKNVLTNSKKSKRILYAESIYVHGNNMHYHGKVIETYKKDKFESLYFYGVRYSFKWYTNSRLFQLEYYNFDQSMSEFIEYHKSGKPRIIKRDNRSIDSYFNNQFKLKTLSSMLNVSDIDIKDVRSISEEYNSRGNLDYRILYFREIVITEIYKNKKHNTTLYNYKSQNYMSVDVKNKLIYINAVVDTNYTLSANWNSINSIEFYNNNKGIFI